MRVAVTGAFGYSGRYITRRLLAAGDTVITLTNSPVRPNPFGDKVSVFPFNFDHPERLTQSLHGVDVLINTYWVRFDHRFFNHDQAVANTKVMFCAAHDAGVRRIVHLSITNPDIHSALPYFRGKAELEAVLKTVGISYCILRPTVLFGMEDILINNIAWALRRLPVFALFGSGEYKLQPIYVDDLAKAAVKRAASEDNKVIDAIGPETFTYRELVRMIAEALGVRRLIIGTPPAFGYWGCRAVGWLMGDVVITREEIAGLMQGLLSVDSPALGGMKLTDWVSRNKHTLGRRYASELARRLDRSSEYRSE